MSASSKHGILGALEEAMARGMAFHTLPAAEIDRRMEETILEVEARYPPNAPSRLKAGRPPKARGRQQSRMKGVRLEVAFLAQLERRLQQEHLSFSGLVQDLLGQWMATPTPRASTKTQVR